MIRNALPSGLASAFALAACLAPVGVGAQPAAAPPSANLNVRATILPGTSRAPPPSPTPVTRLRSGDVSLNFPGVEVGEVAKAVLGDLLHVQYTIGPDLHTQVTVVTQRPIARGDVVRFLEASLASSGIALAQRNGVYAVMTVEQARSQAPVVASGNMTPGFATESIALNFVNAEELRKLIDPILPNVVVQTDDARNTLVVAGTEGQRASIRDLVRQFDVDWLRNMSFALFVPQRTDSRLIVPELDRLINADGAPTHGMVRLIAMEHLNGILAVTTQRQYLDDVGRWIEVLDREGESSERRIFVYRVQNGRSSDLAKVLAAAFTGRTASEQGRNGRSGSQSSLTRDDLNIPPGGVANGGQMQAPGSGQMGGPAQNGGLPQSSGSSQGGASGGGLSGGGESFGQQGGGSAQSTSVDINTDGLHAKISSDETNNAIVVYATPRDYAIVEDALRKLDIIPQQVLIEAAIVEVTLTDAMQYGVQWSFAHGPSSGYLTQNSMATTLLQNVPGFEYAYNGASIHATLDALENLTKIKVISAPKLMVLNNQTASLQVGDQVPVVTGSAVSTVTTGAPVVNEIDYHDTGIILKITPRVNSSGKVLLDISQEVSDVLPQVTTDGVDSPTFSTRRISTSVSAQDGQVVALGGLFSISKNDSKSGIPYLSRIPVLGALFGEVNNNDTKTELIVLLRPSVIHDPEDSRAMTQELRDKLKTLRELLPASPAAIP
jgi:general secretion pathway protein D